MTSSFSNSRGGGKCPPCLPPAGAQVSHIKAAAVNDVCQLFDAMRRSITRVLADFQRCHRMQTHSQSYRKQINCDLNVRRLRMKSKF